MWHQAREHLPCDKLPWDTFGFCPARPRVPAPRSALRGWKANDNSVSQAGVLLLWVQKQDAAWHHHPQPFRRGWLPGWACERGVTWPERHPPILPSVGNCWRVGIATLRKHLATIRKTTPFMFWNVRPLSLKTDFEAFKNLAINQCSARNESTEWFVVPPFTDGCGWL